MVTAFSVFRLEGPFHNENQAKQACEDFGSKLAYWDQAAVLAERFGLQFCQYNILRVPYAVYRINCHQDEVIDYEVIDHGTGYGAICHGIIPHTYKNPCNDKFKQVAGKEVHCIHDDWIVIQDRPPCTHEEFPFTGPAHYFINGFGEVNKGYFLGLTYIEVLTNAHVCSLKVEVWDHKHEYYFALYDKFHVGAEGRGCPRFVLTVDGYNEISTAGNALQEVEGGGQTDDGSSWSDATHDCDKAERVDCAAEYDSSWWFGDCQRSNVNGVCETDTNYVPANGNARNWQPVNGGTEFGLYKTRMSIRCVNKNLDAVDE